MQTIKTFNLLRFHAVRARSMDEAKRFEYLKQFNTEAALKIITLILQGEKLPDWKGVQTIMYNDRLLDKDGWVTDIITLHGMTIGIHAEEGVYLCEDGTWELVR